MKNEKMTPRIRFKGFTDAWEQRKLENVFIERLERAAIGEMLSVTMNNGIIKSSSLNKKDNSSENKSNYKIVCSGDIVYNSMRMWQGASGVSKYNGIVSPAYTVLKKNEFHNSGFYGYLFKNHQMLYLFKKNSQGLTSDTWNLKYPILKNIELYIPHEKNEEIKINSILDKISFLIDSNEEKHKQLLIEKKLLMQKLFDISWRFKGFTDPWEQRKLDEIVNIIGGGTPSSSVKDYWDGGINWFSPSEIGENKYVKKSKKTITNLGLKKSSAQMLPIGTVLFTSRASIGEMAILKEEASTNQGFQSLIPISGKTTSSFIYSIKENLKKYALSASNGSTFNEVSNKSMKKMNIIIPGFNEQKKIGNLFDYIDQLIDYNERKILQLKNLKKYLMQNMFI